jgi:hypothetical protein
MTISGFDVGVSADIASKFSARDLHFENVRQPFEITGAEADVAGTRIRNDPKITQSRTVVGKSHVGWMPIGGPSMPARCSKCSAVFPSANYKIRDSRFWSRDNEEVCPICGYEHAKVEDGLYDITEQAVRMIAQIAASDAVDVLRTIHGISTRLAGENILPNGAAVLLRSENIVLAELVRRALQISSAAAVVLGLVISIASLWYSKASYNLQASDQTEEILESIYDKLDQIVVIEQGQISAGEHRDDSAKSRAVSSDSYRKRGAARPQTSSAAKKGRVTRRLNRE